MLKPNPIPHLITNDELNNQQFALIDRAQFLYGPRDARWMIRPIQFSDYGPQIRFSATTNFELAIELSASSNGSRDQLLFQLANEVVHVLAPVTSPPASMIEEGIATHFSLYEPQFVDSRYRVYALDWMKGNYPNYEDAYQLFQRIEAVNRDAVKMLRAKVPNFHDWTPDFLVGELKIDELFAEALCERRQMR